MSQIKEKILIALKDLLSKIEKAVKEFSRIALLAVVSYFITDGITLIVNMIGGEIELDNNMKLLITGVLTSAFKSIDRQLHENEKAKPEEERNSGWMGLNGLTGF